MTAVLVGFATSVVIAGPASATTCKYPYATSKECSTVTKVSPQSFLVGYRGSAQNNTAQSQTLTCTNNSTVSLSHSVSTTVSASVKAAILAEISASITGSVAASMSTSYGSSVAITVPAYSSRYCTHGLVQENVEGNTVYSQFISGRWTTVSTKTWTSKAPSSAQWKTTTTPI